MVTPQCTEHREGGSASCSSESNTTKKKDSVTSAKLIKIYKYKYLAVKILILQSAAH